MDDTDDAIEVELRSDRDTEPFMGEPEREPFVYPEDALNLVPAFEAHPEGRKWLKQNGEAIITKFEAGYDASREYRERFADNWRIFAGELKPQDGVFKDASNAHLPIMLENISRLSTRAYAELFGDWSNVVNFLPNGPDDDEIATRLSLHINWQIREQIPEFKRQMHRQMMMFFGPGDVTCHTYWMEDRQRPCVEVLSPDEFVTPYVHVSVMPDWSDVPWKAKILNLYRHELEYYRGIWFGVDEVLKRQKPTWDDEPDQVVTAGISELQGVLREDEAGAPYKVIWYEGWEKLPNQEKMRFVQAIIDHRTRAIMRLTIHEQPNWQDKIRHDRQLQELNQYQQAVAANQAAQNELDGLDAQFQQAQMVQAVGPEALSQVAAELEQKRATMPQVPPPPQWLKPGMDKPDPVKMEPINLFAHGVCIEPLVGNLGLGYGRGQADLNKAANVSFQQFVNGACLANGRALITTKNVEFEGGVFKIGPAAHNRLEGITAGQLKDEIIDFQFQSPEPALMLAVDKLMSVAESSIQAPGILSGEPGKSGETYRGAMARIEQATKQLSVATRKNGDMVEQVIKHLAYLNSVFLNDEEIFLVSNHLGQTQEITVGRKLYERGYRVSLRADLRFATLAQRIAESDELVEIAKNTPQLAQNASFMWHALKKSLEARGRHDMVPMLGPEPGPPETTLGLPPPPPPMPPGQPGAEQVGTPVGEPVGMPMMQPGEMMQ